MSALSDKGITLEGLAAAVDSLRQEQATWKALARKQDALSADQITATQSGATAAKISQIAVNTAAIQSLAAQVAGQISLEYVTTLPAAGEPLTLYLVPQGDGTAPNFCNEYLWINNAWELIGTTGAMANNGELTIQVNGVAVGTFTANQAANAAVNITVPTNTNQLVNGAQYVDAAALQTALALKQNNLNATQLEAVNSGITAALVTQIGANQTAIAGKQDKLSTAQQAAVDSGATAAKIDQIASNASAIVSLTSSKQDALSTTQLAAVNSGITAAAVQQISTNADAIATKAADNAVVHLARAETITGDKTWTGYNIYQRTLTLKDAAAVSAGGYGVGLGFFDYAGNRYGYIQPHVTSDGTKNLAFGNSASGYLEFTSSPVPYASGILSLGRNEFRWNGIYDANSIFVYNGYIFGTTPTTDKYWGLWCRDNAGVEVADFLSCARTSGHNSAWIRCLNTDGTNTYDRHIELTVGTDGVTQFIPNSSGVFDLGRTSAKWKSFNGINPGGLSLPRDGAARIDISSAITNTSWGTNLYTPPVDGWIAVLVGSGRCIIQRNGTYGMSAGAFDSTDVFDLRVFCPVIAGATYEIYVRGTVNDASLYPCLGNV